jgi:hypothetical protein
MTKDDKLLELVEHGWDARISGAGIAGAAPKSICVLEIDDNTACEFFQRFCKAKDLHYCPAHVSLLQMAVSISTIGDRLLDFLDSIKKGSVIHLYGLTESGKEKPLGAWTGLLLGEGYDLPSTVFFAITGQLDDLSLVDQRFIERVNVFHRWGK